MLTHKNKIRGQFRHCFCSSYHFNVMILRVSLIEVVVVVKILLPNKSLLLISRTGLFF